MLNPSPLETKYVLFQSVSLFSLYARPLHSCHYFIHIVFASRVLALKGVFVTLHAASLINMFCHKFHFSSPLLTSNLLSKQYVTSHLEGQRYEKIVLWWNRNLTILFYRSEIHESLIKSNVSGVRLRHAMFALWFYEDISTVLRAAAFYFLICALKLVKKGIFFLRVCTYCRQVLAVVCFVFPLLNTCLYNIVTIQKCV